MPFMAVNGSIVHFRDEGPRDGRAIVFSNSLGADFRIWDDVVARIGGGAQFIRYDKRGHGLSELRPAARRSRTMAKISPGSSTSSKSGEP